MCRALLYVLLFSLCLPRLAVETMRSFASLLCMGAMQAMHKLEGFTSKMNVKDHLRTLNVIDHYEPFIDFDALLACASVPPSPPK